MASTPKSPSLPKVSMMTTVGPNGKHISTPYTDRTLMRLMAQFGLDTPVEMEAYMKSPAGKEAINMVIEEIMLEEAFEKQHAQERMDAQIRRQRALGFLLLALLYKKEAKAQAREEEVLAELERIHQSSDRSAKQESERYADQAETMYAAMQEHLDDMLQKHNLEAEKLESEQDKLQKEMGDLDNKYHLMEKELDKAQLKISNLSDEDLETYLEKLNEKIEILSDEVAKQAEEDKDPSDAIKKLNAKALKRAKIQSFLQDNLYTEDGDLIPKEDRRERYQEVAFTLKPDLKLVKHDGQLLIIGKNENVASLSTEKRAQAIKNFEIHRQQYTEVTRLCASNKAGERGLLSTRAEKLAERCDQLNNRMMILTSQLNAIEEGHQKVNQIRSTQQTKPATPHPTTHSPHVNPVNITQSYKHMLMLMGNRTPNPDRLMAVAIGLSHTKSDDPVLKGLLLDRFKDAGVKIDTNLHKQLSSSGPIQPQTLRELQERVSQRPETVNQVTSILSPFSIVPKKPF